MKMAFVFLLSLLLLTDFSLSAQTADSVYQNRLDTTSATAPVVVEDYSDDISPMQFPFFLVFIVFMFIVIGSGVAFALVLVSILFALTSLGLVSTSVIVGLNSRSFRKGFKTLVVGALSIAGLPMGVILFWSVHTAYNWLTLKTTLIFGALAGIATGFLLGILVYHTIVRLTTYFRKKLQL